MGQQNSSHHKADLHKIKIDKSKKDISFGLASMKGWRKFMEDTYTAMLDYNQDPQLSLFAVFDGHAGSQVAIFVRDQFPKELKKNAHFAYGNYGQALRQTFVKMDELLLSDYGIRKLEEIIEDECNDGNAKNLFGESKAGCTALVCLVTPCMIFVANAGDSKGIAFSNKTCVQINTEHKPTLDSEAQRIQNAGGQIIYERVMGDINISRCIGDFKYKQNTNLQRNQQMIICDPQIMQIDRDTCDYFLIGSDGIWQSKNNQAMHNWLADLSTDLKLSKKLSLLFNEQVSKIQDTEYGKDNMTAILVQFH